MPIDDEEDFDSSEEQSGYVPAVVARNLEEAEAYQELLTDNEIPAVIGEIDESQKPRKRGMTRGVPVLVPESLLDEASEIIAQAEEEEEELGEEDEFEDEDEDGDEDEEGEFDEEEEEDEEEFGLEEDEEEGEFEDDEELEFDEEEDIFGEEEDEEEDEEEELDEDGDGEEEEPNEDDEF